MKKQLFKNLEALQQTKNVKALSKEETRKVKGGDDIVIEEIISG